MRDPCKDSPKEATIQRFIKKREFTEALEKAFLAYEEEIKARCISGLRGYVDDPVAEGEELTQEIYAEFHRKLPIDYDPSISQVRTFLYHITARRIQDRRVRPKRNNISYELVSHKIEYREPYSPDPEMLFLDREKVEIADSIGFRGS
jgi:DNA-directed RNA polymerase specialized sigma24 family protein